MKRQTCTAGREAPECSLHNSLPGNRRCPPKCAGKEEALGMERSEMHWPSTDNTGQNAVMEPHKGPLQTKRSILKHAQWSLGWMCVATNWHKGKNNCPLNNITPAMSLITKKVQPWNHYNCLMQKKCLVICLLVHKQAKKTLSELSILTVFSCLFS